MRAENSWHNYHSKGSSTWTLREEFIPEDTIIRDPGNNENK